MRDKRQEKVDALVAKGGMRALINAKCCECIYDPDFRGAGTWRKQIEDCTSKNCPLYAIRPKTLPEKTKKPI